MVLFAFAENVIQLLPDGTLLIHIAMILAMIWILNRTFFRPINQIIESRVKNKGGFFSEANQILKKASEKQAEFDARMLQARTEGYELIEKERRAAVAQREKELSIAKAEVSRFVDAEHQEIGKQNDTARSAIAEEAKKMAETISSNILNSA